MIEELIARVFATRNATHLLHLKTNSYAEHIALGDFYEAIVDKVDAIIECHQGVFGLIGNVKTINKTGKAVKLLKDDLTWFNENRDQISNGVPAIDNLLQELESCYMRTIYKLENLK